MKFRGPWITLLASDHPETAHSSILRPFSIPETSLRSSFSKNNIHQHTQGGCTCWVWGLGVPISGSSQSTCGQFQHAAEPTDLHNFNCDGIFNLCSNDGVSCCVNREVKARKFANAMWSRTCTPCPDVWMRELLVYVLLSKRA
eukprot:1153550-Pelagomonas_calceolata.AAC.1